MKLNILFNGGIHASGKTMYVAKDLIKHELRNENPEQMEIPLYESKEPYLLYQTAYGSNLNIYTYASLYVKGKINSFEINYFSVRNYKYRYPASLTSPTDFFHNS